ncbi:unnamed protein product [Brassicogethes aeneus]|uniref:G-protein coupled receptors family 1 profile domain-containing protein n=1 Tax=Brassicogethes aeneus TaxID=1431903 RepID=A0A9P0F8Q3_BRAAE|nr:unnamed protein product [Brassicogethes aeneus]
MSNATDAEFSTIKNFQLYYMPILITTGLIGNSLSIVVFCKTKLKKLSSAYYLTALAISDNVFLCSLFTIWLEIFEVDVYNRDGFCHVFTYANDVAFFLSVWLVAAFTFERFIVVKYPFLGRTLCTRERAKVIILVLVIVSLTFYSTKFFFKCNVYIEVFSNIFFCVDIIVTSLIPVTLVIFLNIFIIKTILTLSGTRKALTQQSNTENCNKNVMRSQNKITKMLLVISTVFLVSAFPNYIFVMYYIYLYQAGLEAHLVSFTLPKWCEIIFYTTFCINFFVYCLSGEDFRSALCGIFKKKGQRKGQETQALQGI